MVGSNIHVLSEKPYYCMIGWSKLQWGSGGWELDLGRFYNIVLAREGVKVQVGCAWPIFGMHLTKQKHIFYNLLEDKRNEIRLTAFMAFVRGTALIIIQQDVRSGDVYLGDSVSVYVVSLSPEHSPFHWSAAGSGVQTAQLMPLFY